MRACAEVRREEPTMRVCAHSPRCVCKPAHRPTALATVAMSFRISAAAAPLGSKFRRPLALSERLDERHAIAQPHGGNGQPIVGKGIRGLIGQGAGGAAVIDDEEGRRLGKGSSSPCRQRHPGPDWRVDRE